MEQHQFDGDECVIVGPNITHVVVELTGDTAQLCKLVMARDESARVSGIGTMPFKFMQPMYVRGEGREQKRNLQSGIAEDKGGLTTRVLRG